MIKPDEFIQLARIIETGAIPLDFPEPQRQSLIWKGLLLSLRLDGTPEAVALLKRLLTDPQASEVQKIAFRFLGELALEKNQAAGKALYDLAIDNQNQEAIEFLQTKTGLSLDDERRLLFTYLNGKIHDTLSNDPHQVTLSQLFFLQSSAIQERMIRLAPNKGLQNWALLVQAVRDPDKTLGLIAAFPQFQNFEQELSLSLLAEKAETDAIFRNLICQLFILYDYLPGRDLALEKAYHPDDPVQTALFFFLAEDWINYEQIDFSQRLLSTAYELSDQAVRRKILAISRSAGQVDWMKNLSSQSQTRWLKELSDVEWEATLQTLAGAGRYQELWLLAQASPPVWSERILLALNKAQWFPQSDEEKSGFSKLALLAEASSRHSFPFSLQAKWNSPAREISCMALDSSGNTLAAGNSHTAILRWDLSKDALPMPTLFNQSAGTNAICFSPDGNYLVLSSGDQKVRIVDQSRGIFLKTLEGHKGLIRSLAFKTDNRFLYTASFDGTVQTWRFPNGIRSDTTQVSKQELFGLAVSSDGKYLVCAGADRVIQVYSLPLMNLARSLAGHSDTITLLAASQTGTYAVSYSRDLSLKSWNFASGKEMGAIRLDEPLTSLIIHPSGQYVLGGGIQGDIKIWAFPAGQAIHTLKSHPKAVIGLGLKSSANQLISASIDGLICQWDLSLFILGRTPIELLLQQHGQIAKLLKNEEAPQSERTCLEFINELIQWRKRYDIEVAENHPVLHLGEFDIEL